jgi:hypothetical protein
MLKALGSRLTYANVMATVAVFLALGGGAYALTGIPDRSGVYHGCLDPKTGALRVVKGASSCRKTKTVRRAGRRVRILGESAITWNQQGRQGTTGQNGQNGQNGAQGQPGPSRGNFTNCATDTTTSTADGSGGGQSQTRDCTTTVTAPTSGKLLASGSGQLTSQYNSACASGGSATQEVALLIDGAPVQAGQQAGLTAPPFVTRVYGLSGGADVAAGSHTVTFELISVASGICTNGMHLNMQSAGSAEATFVQSAS